MQFLVSVSTGLQGENTLDEYLDGEHIREDLSKLDSVALEQLENLHQYIDAFRIMNLFGMIKELLTSVECPEKFILKDLIMPDTDRTDLFLSGLKLLNTSLQTKTVLSSVFLGILDATKGSCLVGLAVGVLILIASGVQADCCDVSRFVSWDGPAMADPSMRGLS
ncbi:hypothetical protein U1Q18_026113 [Sarracenia purpurea var. burkii]